jgi:hypothetical protein
VGGRHAARLLIAAAAVVACAPGCGGGTNHAAVPDRFSGTWKLRDGRTIPLRRVERHEGVKALRALGGKACTDDAIYFRATYFGGVARLAGCATGDGRRMSGRFNDDGRRGRIFQRLVRDDPPTFSARVVGVGGPPFTVVATRVGP